MEKDNQIKAFLAKKSKSAIVLEMLLNREYVTGSDIINYYKQKDPECPVVFTTCPQGLIKVIRKRFGYDFVKDRDIKFFRTMYKTNGEPYKVSETYKQYFLAKMEG